MTPTKTALEALTLALASSKRGYADVAVNETKPCIICEQEAHGDLIFDAAIAHLNSLTANTWRDIKDAPRDGTEILLHCSKRGYIIIGYDDCYVVSNWRNDQGEIINPPTHWQPLPPKPEQQS